MVIYMFVGEEYCPQRVVVLLGTIAIDTIVTLNTIYDIDFAMCLNNNILCCDVAMHIIVVEEECCYSVEVVTQYPEVTLWVVYMLIEALSGEPLKHHHIHKVCVSEDVVDEECLGIVVVRVYIAEVIYITEVALNNVVTLGADKTAPSSDSAISYQNTLFVYDDLTYTMKLHGRVVT